MTLTVQNLAELSNDDVAQAFALATAIVKEKNPNIDTKRGVIGDLVLGLDAILSAAQKTNVDRVRNSQSVVLAMADSALNDSTVIDNAVSNYRLTRRAATVAAGEVVIVLSQQLTTTSIPAGSVFTASGMTFVASDTYTAHSDVAAVLATTDRLLTAAGTNRWAFTINVTASVAGSAGLLRKDALLIPSASLTAFVQAYASSDFTGGLDAETDAELLAKMETGMSTTAYSNRPMIQNMILNGDASFANILDFSIIGMGDEEMDRDKHWVFPISGGGRTDIYVRTQRLPNLLKLTKTATLIEKTGEGGVWQVNIARADAPGFYEVTNVRLAGAAVGPNYAVTSDVRSTDTTGDIYLPDIVNSHEAVYTRFQTATIQFLDTDTPTGALTEYSSTKSYDVTVSVMPLIEAVQEFVGLRTTVNPCGDHLVKAAVPCTVSLTMTLHRTDASVVINTAVLADALADYVNTTGFAGQLYSTKLSSALASLLPTGVHVNDIAMLGTILSPYGSTSLSSSTALVVPDNPTDYVTSRTVVFILDPAAVTITTVDV